MSTQCYPSSPVPPVPLIGDGIPVPCADGIERPYLSMDTVRRGDRSAMPGAIRASAGINATEQDVARLLTAVARIANGSPPPVRYLQDPRTGDYRPCGDVPGQLPRPQAHQAPCSPG